MRWPTSLLFVLAITSLIGCPVEPGEDDAPSNVASNNEPSSNATNNGSDTTNNTSNATNNGNNSTTDVSTVEFELRPVEWGLFGPDDELQGYYVSAAPAGERHSADVELRPGAYALKVTDEGAAVVDTTGADVDRLVPITGDLESSPFFVPSTTTVRVEAWQDGAQWRVTAQNTAVATPAAIDEVAAATTVGAWFDDAFAAIADAQDRGASTVALMEQVRRHGGPIHTEHGVLFIAPAQDGEPAPQIRGTWNDFGADPASELRRITPGFWARFIDVGPGRLEYKIYYPSGDTWVTDLSNPHIVWDGFDPQGVGDFNSVLRPEGARTVWLPGVESPELGNSRDVYVHLPASYDGGSRDYPVLYLHDGNESIVRGQFQIVADETAAADPTTEAVLVFIALPDQNLRLDEYTISTATARGDEYVDFVAQTLVPAIDAAFRTRTDRAARGVGGASLGGLISYWAATQHPDVFGYAAGMSSTFWWPNQDEQGPHPILDEIADLGCQDISYYLDSGSPADNFAITVTMRDTLDALGCDYDYVLDEGGQHQWSFWRARFDGVLRDFADVHGG